MNLSPYITDLLAKRREAGMPVPHDAEARLLEGARAFTRALRRGRAGGTVFTFLEAEADRLASGDDKRRTA